MRPRIFPSARQQLANACQALRQATQARSEHSQPKDHGSLIAVFLAVFILISLVGYGWHQLIAHAQVSPAWKEWVVLYDPVEHNGYIWNYGDTHDIELPYSWAGKRVRVRATYRGEIPVGHPHPSVGRLGDMYKYDSTFYVWMVFPGELKANWIDP